MTNEEYIEVKELYITHIKDYMKESGGLFPHITVIADQKNKDSEEVIPKAIIHIPIPSEYMDSDDSKDEFIEEIMPSIFKELKKKFTVYGIAWASEAWMRVVESAKFNPAVDNYKEIPIKKEVLFVSIETKDEAETLIYEIKRVGHQVNGDGDLVDTIELTEMEEMKQPGEMKGRFCGLYKKLID